MSILHVERTLLICDYNLFIYLFSTAMMEFSCPTMTGSSPSPRSWHASAVLPRQRIFIHGGYDGTQILADSFILNLGEFPCPLDKEDTT